MPESDPATVAVLLFVARGSPGATRAVDNLQRATAALAPKDFEVEVVDVFAEPERASAWNVLLTPTLWRVEPRSDHGLVGTLDDLQRVCSYLTNGVDSPAAPTSGAESHNARGAPEPGG